MDSDKNQPQIDELIEDLMEARGFGIERLAHDTGIPARFITSILQREFDKLPAQPYIRGYLFKIAEVLEIDPPILWQSYRHSTEVARSGATDSLPANRFAIKNIRASRVVLALLGVVVIGLVGTRINSILGNPTIELNLPETTNEEVISVTGSVEAGDRLTLNEEVIYPNEGGEFSKEIRLDPGLNTLEFRVTRYLGREHSFVRQVFYQPN